MQNLTENAKKALAFIVQYQRENGYSPSIADIKRAIGTKSTRGASMQLDKLNRLGYIERTINARRSIKILVNPTDIQEDKIKALVVGEVKAGYGKIAEQEIGEYKELSIALTGGRRDVFLLKVDGDSMSLAGFNPGDLVIVTPQSIANNGDIVIAIDEESNEGTIKRFRKLKDYAILLPESNNPEHKPKIATHFLIQGKVIGKVAL